VKLHVESWLSTPCVPQHELEAELHDADVELARDCRYAAVKVRVEYIESPSLANTPQAVAPARARRRADERAAEEAASNEDSRTDRRSFHSAV